MHGSTPLPHIRAGKCSENVASADGEGLRSSRCKQGSRRHTPTIPPSSFGHNHLRRESNCSDMVGPAQI